MPVAAAAAVEQCAHPCVGGSPQATAVAAEEQLCLQQKVYLKNCLPCEIPRLSGLQLAAHGNAFVTLRHIKT